MKPIGLKRRIYNDHDLASTSTLVVVVVLPDPFRGMGA